MTPLKNGILGAAYRATDNVKNLRSLLTSVVNGVIAGHVAWRAIPPEAKGSTRHGVIVGFPSVPSYPPKITAPFVIHGTVQFKNGGSTDLTLPGGVDQESAEKNAAQVKANWSKQADVASITVRVAPNPDTARRSQSNG